MDKVQEVLDLLDLEVSGLEDVGRAGVVVHNRDGEDLERHLVPELSSELVVLDGLLELGDRVVVLVGQLPPVRAQLANVIDFLDLQLVYQLLELLVDFGQVLEVELYAAVELGSAIGEIAGLALVTVLHLSRSASTDDVRHALAASFATGLLIIVLVQLLVSLLLEDLLLLVHWQAQAQVVKSGRDWALHQGFRVTVMCSACSAASLAMIDAQLVEAEVHTASAASGAWLLLARELVHRVVEQLIFVYPAHPEAVVADVVLLVGASGVR